MNPKDVGPALKQARKRAGLTMKEAGAAVGVVYQNIDHYEAGRREPPLDNLKALLEAYGLRLVLEFAEPDQRVVPVSADMEEALKGLKDLPIHHQVLVVRLLRLAQRTPVAATRAAVAMMESMLVEETEQQFHQEPRRTA